MVACKICWDDSEDQQCDILDNICACKGSAQAVHKKCLLEWLNVKQNNNAKPSLSCEICLSEYKILATPKKIFRISRFLEQEQNELRSWIYMALIFFVFLSLSVYLYILLRDGYHVMIPLIICIGFSLKICKFCAIEFVGICVSYEILDFTYNDLQRWCRLQTCSLIFWRFIRTNDHRERASILDIYLCLYKLKLIFNDIFCNSDKIRQAVRVLAWETCVI